MPYIVTYQNVENNKIISLAYNEENYPIHIFDETISRNKQIFLLDLILMTLSNNNKNQAL